MRYAGCGERGSQGRREVQAFPAAASAAFFAAAASCFRDDDNPPTKGVKASVTNPRKESGAMDRTCFWRIMLASASIFERNDFPSPSDFLPLFCSAAFFWACVTVGRGARMVSFFGREGRAARRQEVEVEGDGVCTFSRACIRRQHPVSQSGTVGR
jgi:hypothetical protein